MFVCVCVCLSLDIPYVCVMPSVWQCACACARVRTKCVRPRACVRGAMCVCDVAHVDIGKRAHVCAYGPAAVAAVPVRHFKLLLKYDAGQAPIRFSVPCDSRYLLLAIFIVLLVFVSARTCTCTQK